MVKIDLQEFDRLASAERPGLEIYSQIIERLVAVTEAKAGAFWNCDHTPFVPIAHHSVGEAARLGFSQHDHDRILSQVLEQQRSAVVSTKALDNGDAPTIFFAPLKGDTKRVVELVFPSDHRIRQSREFLQELNRLCDVFGKLRPLTTGPVPTTGALTANQSAVANPKPELSIAAFSRYSHILHCSIDRRLTCANMANETRLLLDCDRVSVVLSQRSRFRIAAISGQPSVNRRSNTVQLLEKLAAEVLKAKSTLWYPTDTDIVPQINTLLDQYLLISTTRTLVIQPIFATAPTRSEDPAALASPADEVIGGIIYEHNRQPWTRDERMADIQLTTQHGGDALRNARQHQALFLYPLWRWLGRSKLLTSPALLPKSLLALAAMVAVCLFLTFWPAAFYISASGILVPQQRQLIFAKTTGEIINVPVEHGQWVKKDQPLAMLRSEDLQLRLEDVNGRIETLKQRRSAMERSKFKNSGGPTAAAGAIDENLGSLQAEIDSLQRQADGLSRMQEDLRVLSPVDGQVITWDVAQKLSGRSVTPQNVLMEIADTRGAWQLELDLEDRRIEHLLRGLKSSGDGKLHVKFTLAADPYRTYDGTITEISRAIQLNQDNQQMMRVKVDIDEDALELKQARTGVSAKIYTGEETSLGYLWLHEIPRTLNRYVFFYFVR